MRITSLFMLSVVALVPSLGCASAAPTDADRPVAATSAELLIPTHPVTPGGGGGAPPPGGGATSGSGGAGSSGVADAGAPIGLKVVSSSCASTTTVTEKVCDACGDCTTITRACYPGTCSGGACATSCASAGDCQFAHDCVAGACTPHKASCSSDGRTLLSTSGATRSCNLYLCDPTTNTCKTSCTSSADCSLPATCQGGQCL